MILFLITIVLGIYWASQPTDEIEDGDEDDHTTTKI